MSCWEAPCCSSIQEQQMHGAPARRCAEINTDRDKLSENVHLKKIISKVKNGSFARCTVYMPAACRGVFNGVANKYHLM